MKKGLNKYFFDVFCPRIKQENPLYLTAMAGAIGPEMDDTDRYNIVSIAMVVYRAFELELDRVER